jgi:hypothetical protein
VPADSEAGRAGALLAPAVDGLDRNGEQRGGEEIVLSCEDTDGDPDGGGRAEAVLGRLAELVSGNAPDESRNPTP